MAHVATFGKNCGCELLGKKALVTEYFYMVDSFPIKRLSSCGIEKLPQRLIIPQEGAAKFLLQFLDSGRFAGVLNFGCKCHIITDLSIFFSSIPQNWKKDNENK